MSRWATSSAGCLALALATLACSEASRSAGMASDADDASGQEIDGASRGHGGEVTDNGAAGSGVAADSATIDDAASRAASGVLPAATRAAQGVPCEGDCVARGATLDTLALDARCFSPELASNTATTIFIACDAILPGDNRTEARLWALDARGRELWTRSHTGPEHDRARPMAIAVDLEGGAVMVGDADSPPLFTGESWDNHGFVDRYDASGERIAQDLPVLGARTYPTAVAVAADGDVVVAGNADDDLFVRRYDARLAPRWTATLRSVGGSLLEAYAVTITAEGDVLVAGHDEETFRNWRSFAARLDATGHLLWRSTHDGPSDRDMFRLAVARADGTTLVGGADLRTGDEDPAAVIALDADGAELFRWGEADNVPQAVLIDANDEAVVLMRTFAPPYALHLVGLSHDADETWRVELPGLGGLSAAATWAGGGGILVGGSHQPDGKTWQRYLVRLAY